MARKIKWSEDALADLDVIAEYVARDSAANASKVVKKVLSTVRSLDRFPHLGLVVPEANDAGIRQRLVFHYRIIYRLKSDEIEILSIIHSRRRLRSRDIPDHH